MSGGSGKGRVLVVDDDEMVRSLLNRFLAIEGYEVDNAGDGPEALELVRKNPPDLVLLDLTLPGADGLEVLTELRRDHDVPVILVTARGDEGDRVVGLKLGADDYVVKPFSSAELVARIESVLRRARSAPVGATDTTSELRFGPLKIDTVTREVFVGQAMIATTAKEFDLLAFLAGSPRRVFSREQLLDHVWGSRSDWQDPATVTEHVRRLRHKIEEKPEQPRWIVTVRGVGYRFEP